MPVPLYNIAIPTFKRALTTLSHILSKAEASLAATDSEGLPAKRLCDDMLPLTFQVQSASNTAKKSVWRLTGGKLAAESWPDEEKTMAELQARIAKTIELLDSVPEADINDNEDINVELGIGRGLPPLNVSGTVYVLNYGLPNFYFHVNTAYSILRANGVPIGKSDYLAAFLKEAKEAADAKN